MPTSKEVKVSDQLKQLGFDKFSIPIQGKNLMVWYNGNVIVSSFDKHDLAKTEKTLAKKFGDEGIDQKSARLFTTYLVEEYIKLRELESSSSSSMSIYEEEEQTTTHIIDETKKLRSANLGISFERWTEGLTDRYRKIYDIAERNFPNSWPGIEFTLSVLKILNISQCTLPFAGIMLSRAGGNKTLSSSIVIPWPTVYYTRNFTAKAFVSHNTAVPKEILKDIDMLPKIRFKLLLTPELTPLFSANEDELMENLGIITSVLDGKGYVSHSGAQGRRGYNGNYMFVWVGAAVDIPHRVHKLLATLGPKLYFFRLPFKERTDKELLANLNGNFEKKRNELEGAVIDYLTWFEICPSLIEYNEETGLLKMEWNSAKDEPQAKEHIKELGKLLAKLRGHVDIWSSRQHEYSEYAYSFTQTEDPARAITQLYNLARGHALSIGKNYITLEDVPITAKVVFSTASIERVALFDLMLARGGRITLSEAAKALSMSKSTILKTMTELAALGIVDLDDEAMVGFNQTREITLKTEFRWLLTEALTKMREGFIPVDNSKYIGEEEKRPPPRDKETIFWQRFTELEKQSIDGTVQSHELKDNLVATNSFFVGDAVSMIEIMVESGKLEMVEYGQYRRVKPITNSTIGQTTITKGHNNNNRAKMLLLQCIYSGGEGVTFLPPT